VLYWGIVKTFLRALALVSLAGIVWAQDLHTLSVTVHDPTGAGIPRAKLDVAMLPFGTPAPPPADRAGRTSVALPAGAYDLLVTADGFTKWYKHVEMGSTELQLTISLKIMTFSGPTVMESAPAPPIGDYKQAIREAVQPREQDVSLLLFTVDPSKPVRVVTWTKEKKMSLFMKDGKPVMTAPGDIWVTIVPEVRNFCRGAGPDLTLRIEQRLGLPPGAGYTDFLELEVEPSLTNLFRPCGAPSTTTHTCTAAPPASADTPYASWFYRQYYNSYASQYQYPWTSLGYTFDWARYSDGTFVRYGESEFVIPSGAPIKVIASASTAAYCAK